MCYFSCIGLDSHRFTLVRCHSDVIAKFLNLFFSLCLRTCWVHRCFLGATVFVSREKKSCSVCLSEEMLVHVMLLFVVIFSYIKSLAVCLFVCFVMVLDFCFCVENIALTAVRACELLVFIITNFKCVCVWNWLAVNWMMGLLTSYTQLWVEYLIICLEHIPFCLLIFILAGNKEYFQKSWSITVINILN